MSKSLVRVYRAASLVLAAAALVACSTASAVRPAALPDAGALTPDDQTFIQLREAARNNDPVRAAQLAAMIPDYPAPSYLEYFQLKPQLFDSQGHARVDAPDAQILSFLSRHDGEALADRLRNDYLLVLGARHDWRGFDQQYPKFVLNDDTQVKCYALESRASRGENVAGDARALLVEPRYYGDGCVDLITALGINGQFSADDVWQQIRLAYEQNQTSTGAKLLDALGPQRPDPALFSQAVSTPPLMLARGVGPDASSHQLALLAITVMARNDPAMAASTFAAVAPSLALPERAIGWGTIGYQAALKRMPAALDWYRLSANAPLSNPAYEWRTRAALLGGDWTMVRWSTEQMPAGLRSQPAWVYWHARAAKQGGDAAQAAQEFQQIAPGFNFYGQLAAEELGQKTTIPPKTDVTDAEVAQAGNTPGFALARRFYALNLRLEGNREWNWPLRGMTDRQLLAVAEYARRIQLYDRTVNTADRTQTEHDFSLRYLSPFRDIVERNAQTTGLDVEWAYGLIRQESRFILNARSGVGASGLMQLMPATAQMVAKKIGVGPLSRDQLNDIDTNILLGTNYLSMIYNQFDGSAVLATAGYNAGPGRPRAWRQTLAQPVEGAIFAETIPFQETRDYVKNVLSNTVYYAALFEGRPQSLKARLGYIAP
ncbi:lytic transglycosylase domain-containing protein [Paraburkholderia caballeronis]|uniref:lytic transglycosylase domain-containing protein n=1 Tax=Paraburkholderia caballeronis TaxID=416943 RepID=UPI001066B772|nr:lytic transglycosylase domain-containing protein [Paraburkholderia caballeronis]TDV08106.1 soluble lytic murein transglycosylase [Paraburkholderia caballeronis]TDV11830.1 soluble lytic murein transglycosylase [Paraburkholderia caballeronis]TDV18100.1 soluble lytic murein transglycosylase [Paraburkholderia caballeronis]TDV27901.1 soluble lytic murein transglycosylase [Paraburkholderia caballeronis]